MSSCWMASLICEAPISCSRQAALISETSSAVLRMLGTRLVSMSPAVRAAFTVSPEYSRRSRLRRSRLRSASLRTSEATTAKPRPCSPARAASTAASVFARSVWRAISATMVIFSPRLSHCLHRRHGTVHRLAAGFRILGRLAGDFFGLGGVIGILLDVGGARLLPSRRRPCSAAEACSVAPWLTCSAVADSSWLPEETLPEACSALPTTLRRRFQAMRSSRQAERVLRRERFPGCTVRIAIRDLVRDAGGRAQIWRFMRLTVSIKSLISSLVVISTDLLRSPDRHRSLGQGNDFAQTLGLIDKASQSAAVRAMTSEPAATPNQHVAGGTGAIGAAGSAAAAPASPVWPASRGRW